VHALEVRDFRLIPRFDECFESGLDERGHAATEDRLFSEEVRLRLFRERSLEYAGTGTADSLRVGESIRERVAGSILVYRDECRNATALLEHLAHAVAGRFWRDHAHIDVRWRDDLAKAHIEAVREHQRLSH